MKIALSTRASAPFTRFYSMRAPISHRCRPCIACSRRLEKPASAAIRRRIRRWSSRSCARPNATAYGAGIYEAARTAQVDVLLSLRGHRHLQPERCRLDDRRPRKRIAGQALAERDDCPAGADPKTLTIHADRGSSMKSKTGRVSSGRSRRYQEPLAAARLRRQSAYRSAFQNVEVPFAVSQHVRLAGTGSGVLPRVLHLVQRGAPAQRHLQAAAAPMFTSAGLKLNPVIANAV